MRNTISVTVEGKVFKLFVLLVELNPFFQKICLKNSFRKYISSKSVCSIFMLQFLMHKLACLLHIQTCNILLFEWETKWDV